MDGGIDYSKYSPEQLRSAAAGIDRHRFPQNYVRLQEEIDRRGEQPPSQQQVLPASREPIWASDVEMPEDGTSARIWRYAALFAAVYWSLGFLVGLAAEHFGRRPPWIGIVTIMVAADIVGRFFVRNHKRPFTLSEVRRLMVYCLIAVLLVEALGLLFLESNTGIRLTRSMLLGTAAFAIALDTLTIWLVYRFAVRNTMRKRLAKVAARLEPAS